MEVVGSKESRQSVALASLYDELLYGIVYLFDTAGSGLVSEGARTLFDWTLVQGTSQAESSHLT